MPCDRPKVLFCEVTALLLLLLLELQRIISTQTYLEEVTLLSELHDDVLLVVRGVALVELDYVWMPDRAEELHLFVLGKTKVCVLLLTSLLRSSLLLSFGTGISFIA